MSSTNSTSSSSGELTRQYEIYPYTVQHEYEVQRRCSYVVFGSLNLRIDVFSQNKTEGDALEYEFTYPSVRVKKDTSPTRCYSHYQNVRYFRGKGPDPQ